MRLLVLLFLCACAPSTSLPSTATDSGRRHDGAPDAGTLRLLDAAPGPIDVGATPSVDAGRGRDAGHVAPVDCSLLGGVDVCASSADRCELVFDDGRGCVEACAAAGLICLESHENVEEACAPDTSRPSLGCADTGHGSDHCTCGRDARCIPRCDGRSCGGDGCGGSCGRCAAGLSCVDGACAEAPLDCGAAPYDPEALLEELVGFGRHARGGDPGNVYRVTNTSGGDGSGTLRRALESSEDYWIVFDVGADGAVEIDLGDDPVRVASNKTVDGRGRDVLLDGALEIRGERNIVISDVRLTNSHGSRCTQEADVVLIRGEGASTPGAHETRDIWFHHVEIFEGGDGLIDVRGGSRITISWSHFRDHSKGFLLATRDDRAQEMELTFHHDYFDRISRRGPRVTEGRVHFFNNYQRHWWEYGVAAVWEAQLLSEGNVYEARPGRTCGSIFRPCRDPAPCGDEDYEVSKVAVTNDWAADRRGFVRSAGDLLLNDAVVSVNEPERVFTPGYGYELEEASMELARRIATGAGPRTDYCR